MPRRQTDAGFSWTNALGVGLLATCYLAALVNVARHRSAETQAQTIRILHWQLELGVRDGLTEVIRRFEAAKRAEGLNVRVMQIPISERAYGQYVTTQMIGETAPDLIQLGRFPAEFYGRYFLPFSDLIAQPNPWLARRVAEWEAAATLSAAEQRWLAHSRALADAPWMSSFIDSLRQLYNEQNQEYFGVGFSQVTVRMFYNRDVFRQVLGSDRPPETFGELLSACERLAAWRGPQGEAVQAIAGAGYQVGIIRNRLQISTTADLARSYDLDFDTLCDPREMVGALLRGWTPEHPKYRAALTMMDRLARHFPRGFMALGRMDAGFAFVQGRAAMILSGSWDAQSFLKQVQDQPPERRFEVGVFDLPIPSADDPDFGPYVVGRVTEANTGTVFSFGVTRFSRHADLGVEFLQFCTTPENNELLNRRAQWIPAVQGAESTEFLKAFQPNYVGHFGQMQINMGPRSAMLHNQVYWPLISGEIDYETYVRRLMAALPAEAAVDWRRLYREQQEALPNRYARRAAYLAGVVFPQEEEERAANATKALRSWEALYGYLMARPFMDGILRDVRAELAAPDETPPFEAAFFEHLRREGL
jgi:raffinose/stachyose/melibiose transport system substrate-binding protein